MKTQGKINISPLNMSEVLEITANEADKIPYTADFTDCKDKGYTTFASASGTKFVNFNYREI